MAGQIVFISGGARSGKSSFAEKLTMQYAEKSQTDLFYIATSKVEDDEMAERIRRHQDDRLLSPMTWQTIEQAQDIEKVVQKIPRQSVALLDCVTILITNELFQGDFNQKNFENPDFQAAVVTKIINGIQTIASHTNLLTIVSNEVLFDLFDEANQITFIYQKIIGQVHQKLVALADEAYLVTFGLAQAMKRGAK